MVSWIKRHAEYNCGLYHPNKNGGTRSVINTNYFPNFLAGEIKTFYKKNVSLKICSEN